MPRGMDEAGAATVAADGRAEALDRAARAARRFQLAASLRPGRARARATAREGQVVIDLLWQLGFRPGAF